MATITGNTQEKIFSLKQWGGLNENPDGDTKLKLGEASVMTNWRITRDGNLKRRPGSELVCGCRNGYTESVAGTAQTVFETSNAEHEVTMRSIISATLNVTPGFLALSGDTYVVNYANRATYSGNAYFTYGGKYWKFNGIDLADGVYSWKAYRVTSVPAVGSTYGIAGMWTGWVNNEEVMLVACPNSMSNGVRQGFIYKVAPSGGSVLMTPLNSSAIPMPGSVHMFGFQGKVYFLTGAEYYEWDGTFTGTYFKAVEGYVPIVAVSLTPDGANETLENVNLLNGKRRVWISPDGVTDNTEDPAVTGRTFPLPEKNITVDYVKNLGTDTDLPVGDYSVDGALGKVTINTAPEQGVNSYEIAYTVGTTFRSQVTRMKFSELYSGTQDTRVFLYGDGSNQCIYSGIDYYGVPRADYFADLDACAIGDSNTPITSMIRHYSTLVCYKRSSAWSLTYGVISLTSDTMVPAFYATPVNRKVGNEPVGQVVLVNNSPVTLSNGEVYQWSNSSYYSSNLTQDERQAKRISDRIQKTIKEFDLSNCFCYDDNYAQEYYICYDGDALVWNYAADAWYKYEDFDMVAACNLGGELYYGTSDGKVFHLTEEVTTYDTDPIEAYWESGAMDFGQDYMRKYAAMLWVGIKPDADLENADDSAVTVTVRTDRKAEYSEKLVTTAKARVGSEPFMTRLKIKAKKFTFYTLIFKSDGEGETPTINCADIRVRFQGYAK